MKRTLALLLAMLMLLSFAACKKEEAEDVAPVEEGPKTINLYAFTDEVPGMVDKYLEANPDFAEKFEVNTTIIATTDGAYQPALDEALAAGECDMYAAEAAFILKYSQGDAAEFAAAYEDLGIDVSQVKSAEIAQYTVDIGTRPSDGKLVALGYQATGGAFIYRASIAQAAFGTSDSDEIAEIIGAGSGNWDKFWEAADTLKAAGYKIVSGDGDIWHAVENSTGAWIKDGKFNLDAGREEFIDLSMKLKENGWHNDTQDWQDGWFADMKADGTAFGFFGPAWLINYTLAPNCGGEAVGEGSYGDWRVCPSPIGFFWGGTWVLGAANSDDDVKEAVGDIIEWITLDTTEDGLQYKWANGTLNGEGGTKDTVASGVVMAKSNGELAFLGGQDMFPAFIEANKYATGANLTQYDETINGFWRGQVRNYTAGTISREEAIEAFKGEVRDNLDVVVD